MTSPGTVMAKHGLPAPVSADIGFAPRRIALVLTLLAVMVWWALDLNTSLPVGA